MNQQHLPSVPERLMLRSRLGELARVFSWVDALAAQCAIPERTAFAIHLCLEEAISNVIRHGYGGDPNQAVTVQFKIDIPAGGERAVSFIVEDSAPHFRPFDPDMPAELHTPTPLEEIQPGGLGIPLLRKFASAAEWEPLENGNRLTLRFAVPR